MKSHSQQQDLASLAASISQKAEATKQLASEVKQLQDGIAAMDQSIATAGETRKAEHQEFQELMTSDAWSITPEPRRFCPPPPTLQSPQSTSTLSCRSTASSPHRPPWRASTRLNRAMEFCP